MNYVVIDMVRGFVSRRCCYPLASLLVDCDNESFAVNRAKEEVERSALLTRARIRSLPIMMSSVPITARQASGAETGSRACA
jgi:hypothetical protein